MADLNYVYHYTSVLRWNEIKESGYLKLTPSNLKNLKNPKMVKRPDGTTAIVDETDDYKPVVWLTESTVPQDMGLENPQKMRIQIAIPYDKTKHHWWWTWKDRNRADKKITKFLICHGEKYTTWYVCEEIIPFEDFIYVKDLATDTIIYEKKNS